MADAAWRLARALFRSARAAGEQESVAADLDRLTAVLAAAPDVRRVIHHPRIGETAKTELLDGVIETELLRRLVVALIAMRDIEMVPAINRQFRHIKAVEAGVVRAEVSTAARLNREEEEALGSALERYLGRRVALSVSVDPSLIAGLRVRIDDRVLDASLKAELAALEKQLLVA